MSEENKSMELTKEQLGEITGGVGKKGIISIKTLVLRNVKNAAGTKAQAVSKIKAAEFTDSFIISRGVVEAFVEKYWDLV